MTPLTVVVAAFIGALVLFGFAFWTPVYAIPLALLFLIGVGVAEVVRRRGTSPEVRELRRREPGADDVHFDDRDRETLYEGDR